MSGVVHVVRHVVIRGRVQRVGYRAWTEHVALQRGLEGWVRNRIDGSVEAVFCGPATVVEGMIEACRRGPPVHLSRRSISAKAEPQTSPRAAVGKCFRC